MLVGTRTIPWEKGLVQGVCGSWVVENQLSLFLLLLLLLLSLLFLLLRLLVEKLFQRAKGGYVWAADIYGRLVTSFLATQETSINSSRAARLVYSLVSVSCFKLSNATPAQLTVTIRRKALHLLLAQLSGNRPRLRHGSDVGFRMKRAGSIRDRGKDQRCSLAQTRLNG